MSPPPTSALAQALAGSCPRCGRASLFRGLLAVRDTCPACGLDLRQADTGDGPAVFVIFALGAVLVPLALLLDAAVAPPTWVHLLVWTPLLLLGTVALLRPVKAFTIGLQYRHRSREMGG